MTDNEIIKALGRISCKTLNDCKLINNAIDLINRQKSEIERLQNDLAQTEEAFNKVYEMNGAYARKIDFAKAEATKECTDKIKAKFDKHGVDYTAYAIVDDVAKEMGVDGDENTTTG